MRNTPDASLRIIGLQLTSAYDRHSEAERQAGLIPLQSPLAWVYGIGLGDLPRSLLDRNELERLNIVILNSSVAVAALTYFDHSHWLTDPRVALHNGDEAELAVPLAANPACLILASATSAGLRDRVFLELATPFIRRQHSSENSEIQDRIVANDRFIKHDGDVASMFGGKLGATIMVAAAGPSLTQNLSKILHHKAQFPLLAVNSALKPLAQAGIVPDAVMAIDSDPKIISCFEGIDLHLFENVPLIYFPRVPKTILAIWPGPRLVAFSEHPASALSTTLEHVGMEGEASEQLVKLIDLLTSVLAKAPPQMVMRINPVLAKAISAIERKDYLYVAGTIEYEIAPLLLSMNHLS